MIVRTRKARPGAGRVGVLLACIAVSFLTWLLLHHGPGVLGGGADRGATQMSDPRVSASGQVAPSAPATSGTPGQPDVNIEGTRQSGVAIADATNAGYSGLPPTAAAGRSDVATPATPGEATLRADPIDTTDQQRFPRNWRRCFREYGGRNDGYTISSDSAIAWSGSWSAKISSRTGRPSPPGAALCQVIAATAYSGQRVRATLHMRTQDAMPGAHMVFRAEGGDGRLLAFYNMAPRWIGGTQDWAGHSVILDVPEGTMVIVFGGALVNTGSLWMDDASIEVVGKDLPVTHQSPPMTHYNQSVDPVSLSRAIQNPGFEDTRRLDPDE